jgi:hypothetical protein
MSGRRSGPPDEDALRGAAGAGDVRSAIDLAILLLGQDRHEEARSWLEGAFHSRRGPEAAFHLGRSFYAQDRRADAEVTWLVAAHAGHRRGAMALAELLEEAQRPREALHWLREVAGSDHSGLRREAADRMAELRVTEFALTHAVRKDWEALWSLVLSTPIAEAAPALEQLRRSGWRPAAPRDRAVAERLLAADREAIARVADRATRLSTRILPYALDHGGAGAAELVGDDPVIAFSTLADDLDDLDDLDDDGLDDDDLDDDLDDDRAEHASRLYTLRVGGEPSELHAGPGSHRSFGLLGPRTVLSVCVSGDRPGLIRWGLLRIGQEGTEEIEVARLYAHLGVGTPYPQLATTQDGFIVGLDRSTQVIVGSGDQVARVDLAHTGIRKQTNIFAVDPTGTLAAFADEGILFVVDTRSWEVVATRDLTRVDGGVENLVFTTSDRLVSAGPTGMRLWAIENGGLQPLSWNELPWTDDLFAVPAWNVVGRMVVGSPECFDDATLDRVAIPAGLTGCGPGTIERVCAAPGGRFVVYGGQFLNEEGSYDDLTAVHDLRHPLSWVHRPPTSLTDADRADLAALLDGRPTTPGAEHVLAADERQVLELVQAAAECCAP